MQSWIQAIILRLRQLYVEPILTLWRVPFGKALVRTLLGLIALLLLGLIILWPGEKAPSGLATGKPQATFKASVAQRLSAPCVQQTETCFQITYELAEGEDIGRQGEFTWNTSPNAMRGPAPEKGANIIVARENLPASADTIKKDEYVFSDFDRSFPILALLGLFVVLVVVVSRSHGLLSLIGLIVSLGTILLFILPALLTGGPPLLVALVGCTAVMLATLFITHGVGAKSIAAVLGTLCTLLFILGMMSLFIHLTHLTGVTSDATQFLLSGYPDLSLSGILLAGAIIGALGVLDDVTVSQASTVLALRRNAPHLSSQDLFREAMRVGRDHVAATINTLVLAYVGAALPLLLLFYGNGNAFSTIVFSEIIAQEIVITLVGSLGLILAVPATTMVAAYLAQHLPDDALPATDDHHHH